MSASTVDPSANWKAESYPSAQQAEARTILETLKDLKARELQLKEQLDGKKKEIATLEAHAERVKTTREDIARMKEAYQTNQDFLKKARNLIANPGLSEREIMEKKLIALKGEVTEKEGRLNQKRASFDSYRKKLEALQASKLKRLSYSSDILRNMGSQIEKEMIPVANAVNPSAHVRSILEICKEREAEIATMQTELETLTQKDREVTTALQALQESIQEAIPRVEAEKDDVAQGILSEWEMEKQNLIGVYGRLCVINREQNYHLMRGTHIKRAGLVDKQIGPKERRLNLDNTDLAREVNQLRDKVNVTEADVRSLLVQLTHVKKLNDTERKNFQAAKVTADEKVQEANNARQELQIENNELRKLKSELLGVLQSIRENHLSIQRNALMDAQPPVEAMYRIENGPSHA